MVCKRSEGSGMTALVAFLARLFAQTPPPQSAYAAQQARRHAQQTFAREWDAKAVREQNP